MPIGTGERLLEELLMDAHAAAPMDVPQLADRYATSLGLERVTIHLVDLQQRLLVPLSRGEPVLGVDDSLAGWSYRTVSLQVANDDGGELVAWLPLVDGAERLGVLGVRTPMLDGSTLRRCRMLAALLPMVITSKRTYSDSYARQTRSESMRLTAEMLRAFLPPRTLGTERVVSTAVLEPAYELGGDAFDHSLTKDTLHAAILDAMGHDLASGLTASVAMAGCRNARRNGADLVDMVHNVDQALATWLPDRFCTGVFLHLDLSTGCLRWINCGHPPPLLIRAQRVIEHALEGVPEPPLGLPARLTEPARSVHEVSLEPGDRVLLYTDGVTEARADNGELFGLDSFTEFIIRATAAGEPAPETLRRLVHAILGHQRSRLTDDATILLVEWLSP
nr:PP2C family protein-serine/threonine phosphatase [Spinactinospora alkalitolerans]